MKLLKALGVTTLISGAAVIPTWIYNEARWENQQKLWWTQNMVRRYNPDKYEELKNSGVEDLKIWQEAELMLMDSVEHERAKENEIHKSYFKGSQSLK